VARRDANDNGTDGQTDRQTDGQTDRVRRNMRPPPREEGRIINPIKTNCAQWKETHTHTNRLKINRYCNCNCGTQYSVQQFW